MKKLIVIAILAISCWFTADAQVSFSLNIGSQPAWGPVGYDRADYYYLPDAGAYYDINRRVFVYRNGTRWDRGAYLPGRYRNMDLYNAHKVVITNQRDPWNNHNRYYNQYSGYKGRRGQASIRDARDQKYWQNPGNRNYGQWKRDHNPGRGRDNNNYDRGRGNDNRGGGNGNGNGRGNGNNGNGNGNGRR